MTNSSFPPPPTDSAYIAHLWDYPHLTVAIFGMQAHTPEGYAMYEAAGIPKEMEEALAHAKGLLCVRLFQEGNGGLQLQYGRSPRRSGPVRPPNAAYGLVEVAK